MSAPTTPAPLPGPRDLGPSVARLLRQLGFQVWEQPRPTLSLVTATWTGLSGESYRFQYVHHHPAAGPVAWAACQMGCQPPGPQPPQVCFADTQVRRLREVRLLLLQNEQFAQARQRLRAAQQAAQHSGRPRGRRFFFYCRRSPFTAMNSSASTAPATYTLGRALALVFGSPPFSAEYTTDHIRRVLSKLVGQDVSEQAVLEELRTAAYATPRPGRGRHLLKWRFSRAEVEAGGAPAPPRRHKPPRQERSVAQSMGLKR